MPDSATTAAPVQTPDPKESSTTTSGETPVVDALLEALLYVARHHGKQISRDGLISGLPLVDHKLIPSLVSRAASRAGLESNIVILPLDALTPEVLPAIVVLDNNQACVLLEQTMNTARVIFANQKPESIASTKLGACYAGSAILLRPSYEFDERAPEVKQPWRKHWFWGAMASNIPLYRDVLLAATLVNIFAMALPLFTMNVYDRVVPNRAVETLWILASGLTIVLCSDFLLRTMRGYFLDLASKRIDIKLSGFIMERVLGIRLEQRPASVGSFASSLRSFETVRDFITSLTVTALIDLPFALLFLLVIAWIAVPMIIPILVAMAIVVGYGLAVGARMHELSESTYRAGAMRNATLIESLVGLESVKALGAEGIMQGRWERSAAYLAAVGAQTRLLANSTLNTAMTMQQFVTIAIVIIGVYRIAEAELTMGGLIACSMLAGRAMAPLGQIAGLLTQYHSAITALGSLDQIVSKPVERPSGANFLSRPNFAGELEFRDVSFAYPGTEMNALRGVSIRIKAGEKVAVLGRTGSGKSTILRLALGLYQPTAGAVLVDGIDIRQLDPGELRRNLGYVPQDVVLFYGTLRENITISTRFAEDAEIIKAAEIGNIAEFVNLHPRGFDMIVGERGDTLSGGQREGVAIARAVLNDPPILLLDEPTGSMDHSGEETVKARLREYIKNRTVLIVTHRTALLDLVDRIIVTDNGKIVADGPKAQVVEALRQGRVGKAS